MPKGQQTVGNFPLKTRVVKTSTNGRSTRSNVNTTAGRNPNRSKGTWGKGNKA